jgi:hypothetical protein
MSECARPLGADTRPGAGHLRRGVRGAGGPGRPERERRDPPVQGRGHARRAERVPGGRGARRRAGPAGDAYGEERRWVVFELHIPRWRASRKAIVGSSASESLKVFGYESSKRNLLPMADPSPASAPLHGSLADS